jgi:eukaryotic-like serine/threonine-protein kinase
MQALEEWQRLQQLFELALHTPENERERVLETAGADPRLKARILQMVQGVEQEAPAASEVPACDGRRLGAYTLVRLIDTGGMGAVYLAERLIGGVPQRVALKVLAPRFAGASFLERFRREQHILASLDHPHITRLLDAGVGAEGEPYLVMEYVEGIHIDRYCDARHLDVSARISLLIEVAEAIAYAHRNLVVHLDLKPSNILVTQEGVVKVLDFGASKLLAPDQGGTTTLMATPAYAAPEQLRGEVVTTACDIYSLGAVLFHLLSGGRVESNSLPVAIENALREREPQAIWSVVDTDAALVRGVSPARLRQILQGDIGTIVAKCLRPRARDRYTSVDALLEDLRRYQAGRPVLARPHTAAYLLGKYVRRHRLGVTAGVLIALMVLATLLYAGWRQEQAVREGQRALAMQSFVYRLFKVANAKYTGKPAATVPEFLQLGARLVSQFIKDPYDLRRAQLGLAESMLENDDLAAARSLFKDVSASARVAGDVSALVEAEAFGGNAAYLQGDERDGDQRTARALALAADSAVPMTVRVWAETFYAWNRDNNGYRTAQNLQLLQRAATQARASHLPAREMADVLYSLASDVELRGDLVQSETLFRQVIEAYGADPTALCDRSKVLGDLAFIAQMSGNLPKSLPLYQQAYAGYAECSGPESRGALNEQEYMAGALTRLGRGGEGYELMRTALPLWRKLDGTTPDFSEPLNFMTLAELATGRYADAEGHAREMVEVQTGKVDSQDRRFGMSHYLWAEALVGQGRNADALPHARIAAQLLARNAVSPGARQAGREAQELLAKLQDGPAHAGASHP